MKRGARTHQGEDWRAMLAGFRLARARQHLDLLAGGDTSELHLAHAACRLLMELERDDRDAFLDQHRMAPRIFSAMVPGVSQPGDPLRPSRTARWTLSTEEQRLTSRSLEGWGSNHKSVPVYGRRRCARRINVSAFRYGVRVIALPLFDSVKAKPPVAANAKARQFSFSEQPVNCSSMNVQIFGQFRDG
jgi:hypothetical protein